MKYFKATLFVILCLGLVFLAVMGWVFTDYAESKFWQTAWVVIAIAAIPAFIGSVIWFSKSQSKW